MSWQKGILLVGQEFKVPAQDYPERAIFKAGQELNVFCEENGAYGADIFGGYWDGLYVVVKKEHVRLVKP